MTKNNSTCISKTFTLDPQGKLSDLRFMVLVYYYEHKSREQIGEIFGCKEDFAKKHLDLAFKDVGANSLNNSSHKAWLNGHLNHTNCDADAAWRKNRYYYEGKRFYLK